MYARLTMAMCMKWSLSKAKLSYLYPGFQGVGPRAVVCLPKGEALGKTYNFHNFSNYWVLLVCHRKTYNCLWPCAMVHVHITGSIYMYMYYPLIETNHSSPATLMYMDYTAIKKAPLWYMEFVHYDLHIASFPGQMENWTYNCKVIET